MYDITEEDTFTHVTSWLDEINLHCADGTVDLILLGNKNDLAHTDRNVPMAAGTHTRHSQSSAELVVIYSAYAHPH